jgi:DNA-binding GntR family transcriptional regulator
MSTTSAPAGEGCPGPSPAGQGRVVTDPDLAPFAADEWPYKIVADRLELRIRRGDFAPSGRLPSARQLMAHYEVSLSVVAHARRELKERALIRSAGPHGTFAT